MLNRREMLVASGVAALATAIPFVANRAIHGGWLDLPEARRQFIKGNSKPYFRQHDTQIKGTGRNKEVLLWKFYEQITGEPFSPHIQEIGDCCGQACALGVDVLAAVQIGLYGKSEEWRGKHSTETIYSGSRIEIAKGTACFDWWGQPADGSTGVWVGEYVRDYGVLLRGKYGNIDLTRYRPDLAKIWGSSTHFGVPDDLEVISQHHPVETVTVVEGWEQAADSVSNGYPVVIASSVGFKTETDRDGFLARGLEPWWHCMLLWGIDTKSKREGGCIANSWGTSWISGPQHKLGTPAGCFWTDANVINAMLKQGDSVAISNFVGFPQQQQNLDYRLW